MARASDRIADNVDGEFFVDSSCIDCDLCRQLEPAVFARSRRAAQSYVAHQPADPHRALMALVTCPTSSIGTQHKLDSRAAARALPEVLDAVAPDVMFCGWAAESSYGAAAWLIRRDSGNVLVDSPRASSTLFDRLAELGGVRYLWLSHRDDVADHRKYHARFGCERIIHRDDASGDTRDLERFVDGDAPIVLAPDLTIVPVPGHTRGSCALVYRDTFAFTGDHVWASDDGTKLEAGRDVCWCSWPEQRRSMARLADHRFTWVLPGHGRRFHASNDAAMASELRRLAATM